MRPSDFYLKYDTEMKRIATTAALLLALTACGEKQAPLPLEGTEWKLVELKGEEDASVFDREADAFRFTLDPAEKMIAGKGACNRFFGPYELTGENGIELGNMGMTRMACPGMDVEAAFVAALDEADSYSIEGDRLTLFDDGEKIAVLKAAPQSSAE